MLNLQNIWFVLDLIISWEIVGVPDKPEYSLRDSPLHFYLLGHNVGVPDKPEYSLRDSPLHFYILGHNLKDNVLISQLMHEDHAIC
jgi:hypothetical protein